jgi:hypothetical protein
MSRAARFPKTAAELEHMSLDEMNAHLSYLHARQSAARGSRMTKAFAKEIAAVQHVRQKRFGISPR